MFYRVVSLVEPNLRFFIQSVVLCLPQKMKSLTAKFAERRRKVRKAMDFCILPLRPSRFPAHSS
jgi:hypothetical protein